MNQKRLNRLPLNQPLEMFVVAGLVVFVNMNISSLQHHLPIISQAIIELLSSAASNNSKV